MPPDNEHKDRLRAEFARDPAPLVSALGLRIDDRKGKTGEVWVFDHGEHDASIKIQTDGQWAGTWKRFGGEDGDSGDCFSLVKREGRGTTFPEQIAFVESVYHIEAERPKRKIGETAYDLVAPTGGVVAVHRRIDFDDGTKTFTYERDGKPGLNGVGTAELPLYGMYDVLDSAFVSHKSNVFVCEGEKAADALRERGFSAVGTACGASVCPEPQVLIPLAPYRVILWPDNDKAGRAHMMRIARVLKTMDIACYWLEPQNLEPKDDAWDFWERRGGTEGMLKEAVAALEEWVDPETLPPEAPASVQEGDLPKIVTSNRPLHHQTAEAVDALVARNDPPRLFARDTSLVTVAQGVDGRPMVRELDSYALRGEMARSARYGVTRKVGDETRFFDGSPPMCVVEDIGSEVFRRVEITGRWAFGELIGVVESPVIRADGTILQERGYDAASRLFYAPSPDLHVPEIPSSPSTRDVCEALGAIEDLIAEFPFAGVADWENMLALLLTLVMRPAIAGCVPIAILDASRAGTGKSLLAKVAAMLATGRDASMLSWPRGEEECQKAITSVLRGGPSVIVIDNVDHGLGSASLARALTAEVWEDRLLGKSETVHLPCRAVWMATGNNLELKGDLPRRCYRIRMEAKTSTPHMGRKFKYPDLVGHVLQHRGELIAALLTIARAWYADGCPATVAPILGSFEDWSRCVGGAMTMLGKTAFLGNLEEMYDEAAVDDTEWFRLLDHIVGSDELGGGKPFSVRQFLERLEWSEEMKDLVPASLCDHKGEVYPAKRIAAQFRRRAGARYGPKNVRLERGGTDGHTKSALWRVLQDGMGVRDGE